MLELWPQNRIVSVAGSRKIPGINHILINLQKKPKGTSFSYHTSVFVLQGSHHFPGIRIEKNVVFAMSLS